MTRVDASDMLAHSPSGEELRRFLLMVGCYTMTVKKQDFSAFKTMLKQMPSPKLTAFFTSMACAQQAGAETSFASQSLENHQTEDWTQVMCVALGTLACLVLVAFHDGRRYSVKNHEVEVKNTSRKPWRLR